MTFDPDDPRLSAHALGELEPAEAVEVEAMLAASPEARAALEEIRAAAWVLTTSLAREAAPGLGAPQRLAIAGLVSSTLAYIGWGAATEGWMMFAVVFCNVLGFTVAASMQSIISSAADATTQGRTMGAVSGLQSLMAVVAPVIGAPLLGIVSHLPRGDWRIGAPFYFGALVQAVALVLAWTHFHNSRRSRLHAAGGTA